MLTRKQVFLYNVGLQTATYGSTLVVCLMAVDSSLETQKHTRAVASSQNFWPDWLYVTRHLCIRQADGVQEHGAEKTFGPKKGGRNRRMEKIV
jgi:hypothetical protein